MQFIGITAAIDAVLVLISYAILMMRQKETSGVSPEAKLIRDYFSKYLMFMFVFLALVSVAMISLRGTLQGAVVLVADVGLWLALGYMIALTLSGYKTAMQWAIGVLAVFALISGVSQLFALAGLPFDLGSTLNSFIASLGPILMYAVWIPAAIVFLGASMRSKNQAVRMRSLLFAVGLLFTTYSWVARLQLNITSIVVIALISIVGFAMLLGGILYQGTTSRQPAMANA